MSPSAEGPLTLRRVGDERPISRRANVASSFLGRLRGLMGRPHLPDDECLYLAGTNGVHMLFMRFPIDCLFLGEATADGSEPIVAVRGNLAPWRGVVWYVRGARSVVELPAGKIDDLELQVGDRVRLETAIA